LGKRSSFERKPRDYYPTIDPRAVRALAPFLAAETQFIEPCAGAFDLAALLIAAGHLCMDAMDIEPAAPGIRQGDALQLQSQPYSIITNTPWRRDLLHPMIEHFVTAAPEAWLLIDANWFHTLQAAPLLQHCTDYVSIGRLHWERDRPISGKDDAAWYRFELGGNGKGIRAWPINR